MRVLAIANNTFKEAYRQPIYLILLSLSAALILLSYWFTLFGFGEEIKMMKDMGFTTITLCGLLMALFTCSSVISDEIEKKTVLTILCKPVTRIAFVVGKFLGVIIAVFLASVILTIVLLIVLCMYYSQDLHDATLASALSATLNWTSCKWILLAVIFSYLQVVVLTAISVAISTRFPMIINVAVCLAVFVVGHLSTHLYVFFQAKGEITKQVGRCLYLLLPNLENLNITSPIALGTYPSSTYCLLAVSYALVYTLASLALAALLFRDREVM